VAQNIDVNINVKLTNEQRIAQLEKEIDKLQKTGNKSIVSFNQLASAVAAVVSVKFISDVAQANLQFQQLAQKVNIAAGSAEAGAQALNNLRSFAKDSAFSVGELSNTFIRLKSAGIEPSTSILEIFNKAAEASTDKTGTLEAMTTLFSKAARGAGIDMKSLNQLAGDGIPVFEILQKKLGMNSEQLQEFTKDGMNAAPVLRALKEGISELNVTPIINDLEKSFKNLKQSFTEAQLSVGEGGLNAALVNLMDTIGRLLDENKELIHNIGAVLGAAINIAAGALEILVNHFELFLGLGIAAAMIIYAQQIGTVILAIRNLTFATAALNAVMAANPILRIAAVAIAAGFAIYDFAKSAEQATKSTEELNEQLGSTTLGAKAYGGIFDKNTRSLGLFTEAQREAQAQAENENANQKAQDLKNFQINLQKKIEANRGYLDTLRQMGMTENEKLIEEEMKHLDRLREIRSTTLDDEALFLQYKENIHKEYANRRLELEKRQRQQVEAEQRKNLDSWKAGKYEEVDLTNLTEQQKLEILGSTAKQALEVAATQNKKAFMLNKAVAISQALISTFTGAAKAIEQGGVFGPFLAAAVVAAGLAQVAAIRSQQYPGREKGGTVVAGKPYMVGEAGPELFQPGQTGRIVPNDQLAGNGDIVNINFNVSTVDAKGFDELLSSRRELIVNTVNEAMRERGMRGLTA
jgi:tape measure domain-containing protein